MHWVIIGACVAFTIWMFMYAPKEKQEENESKIDN